MNDQTSQQQIVLMDSRLPSDQFILEGIDVTREPLYSVSEAGKVFFARSPHWVRWRERKGDMSLDGEPVSVHRTKEGARKYNLADIEMMAHALAEKGAINGSQLTLALLTVQVQAKLYGYI